MSNRVIATSNQKPEIRNQKPATMTITEISLLILIGLAAGIFSGMFGIGGGLIVVPALVFLLGMGQHAAQGTSIGLMLLPIGILAAYNYHRAGNLSVKYGIIMAIAFVLGGYFGSRMSLGIDEITLKRLFGMVMFIFAIKLIFFPGK